ncbi:cell division cycle protein [Metarhizium guizhouense ARSEF 977]|uniref:Cell division cycle protein n=1 Tax=Metarhizium guizhouense (strain ARSEF 977) TaxID=1276136 RepID=A0A0B4HL39_METGA|nr:cell division cycle protein [Metarhizium guizhouense ARSEF 977]
MAPGAADPEPQWPPRSPHEALLSTPGGRQRYREMMNRTSPSPSPMRSARALAAITSSPGAGLGIQSSGGDDDDDEDEETLQLKLQEIQAKLKLKRLQNAKAREKAASHRDGEADAQSDPVLPSPNRRARARTPGADENVRPASQNQVTVPASPVRKLQFLQQQTSPSRVFLGIDKGLKAKDVSLKRAPSQKGNKPGTSSQTGGYLNRSRPVHSSALSPEAARPLSFNERLASARTEEAARAERIDRIQRARTNAFSIGQDEMERFKKSAVEIPDEPLPPPTFTREEILSQHAPAASKLPRSKTAPSLHQLRPDSHNSNLSSSTLGASATDESSGTDEASFEVYSCFHLSKRILPHTVVTRHVSKKKILNIKDLLRDVKSPDYALPDVEQDIVVFAVVARKSEPRAHKPTANQKQEDRGKYLVMTLTDLDFELDLFLFNSGFTRFWKLTEGTVVAILNPNIMPPPPGRQDTGRFSLVINSDEDTILEIGSARDLGFCQSVKKDGDLCGAWVNKKKTHFCEFHSNEAIRKQRSSRVEVNSSGFGGWEKRSKFGFGQKKDEKKKGSSNYDWETRTQWFAARSLSAADLIDGKDRGAADRKEKAESVKRSLEAKEKEREMMKKLGKIGNAAGREYMERAGLKGTADQSPATTNQTNGSVPDQEAQSTKRDALSLGLTSKDRTIHLSPIKRKRPDSSQASSVVGSTNSSSTAAAFGWGSNLRNKLSKMKEGEKLHKGGDPPPVRKKTRFVTEKGIREAGRDSLGMDFSERQISLDDDDDELIIV